MSTRIALTVTTLDGDDNFVPQEGLEQSAFKFIDEADNVTEIPFSGFSEQGNGNYVFYGFSIANTFPFKKAHLKINDVFQYGYGLFTLYTDNDESGSQSYNDARFGRLASSNTWTGATNQFEGALFGEAVTFEDTATGQDFEMDTNSDLYLGVDEPDNPTLIWKKYADENYIKSDSTSLDGFYRLGQVQTVTANHTYNQTQTFTGVFQADFPFIRTSSSLYVNGNPQNSNLVWKKWVVDNFEPIGSSAEPSNTVIVDNRVTADQSLKIYSTINGAITDIVSLTGGATNTDVWTINVRQHSEEAGYTGEGGLIELPDYFNLVGEGMVKVFAQIARDGTGSTITSKVKNMIFETNTFSHDVQRLEAVDCVFISTGEDVDLERSNLRNCEFYGANIYSSNNNKIKGCFGNRAVTWQAGDDVWTYDYKVGVSY